MAKSADQGKNGLSYAQAGVDIDAGNALVDRIKPAAKSTDRPGVMAGLGGFGGLFDLKAAGFVDPVLVAATDGVGTKLRIAIDTGHVDGVAEVVGLKDEGDSTRVTLRAPKDLAKFIAPKGSVSLNGTSLTVNEVEGCDFGINFIPHTKAVTTWGQVEVGDMVNLEIDTLARYVARLAETTESA